MRIVETDVNKNLATVFEDIVFCAKIAGHEAARGKKGSPTILHDEIENIKELLKQCDECLRQEEINREVIG
jgi:hypothetical protein